MTLLDTLSDPVTGPAIGGIGVAVVGAVGAVASRLITKARRARTDEASEAVAVEQGAAAVVPDLREVIREYRAEVREARAEMRAMQAGREADRHDYEAALGSLQEGVHASLKASDEHCDEMRKADRAELEAKIDERDRRCEERLDAMRADLGFVAARQLHTEPPDDTGVHRALERIVRRTPTPPEPMAAQPEERRGELVPRKPATEIPPPPRGPKENR